MNNLEFIKSTVTAKTIRGNSAFLGAANNLLAFTAAMQMRIIEKGHHRIAGHQSKSGAPFSLINAD